MIDKWKEQTTYQNNNQFQPCKLTNCFFNQPILNCCTKQQNKLYSILCISTKYFPILVNCDGLYSTSEQKPVHVANSGMEDNQSFTITLT